MGDLRTFLKGFARLKETERRPPGWRWTSIEALLLDVGREWTYAPRPVEIRPGPKKECFRNAFLLAVERPDLTYVEGYASAHGVPVHHAWTVDAEGHVVDATWGDDDADEVRLYFGVPISPGWLSPRIVRAKVYGALYNWKVTPGLMTVDPKEWMPVRWLQGNTACKRT